MESSIGDSNTISINQTDITLEALLPGRNYSITVQAVSKSQESSEEVSVFQQLCVKLKMSWKYVSIYYVMAYLIGKILAIAVTERVRGKGKRLKQEVWNIWYWQKRKNAWISKLGDFQSLNVLHSENPTKWVLLGFWVLKEYVNSHSTFVGESTDEMSKATIIENLMIESGSVTRCCLTEIRHSVLGWKVLCRISWHFRYPKAQIVS